MNIGWLVDLVTVAATAGRWMQAHLDLDAFVVGALGLASLGMLCLMGLFAFAVREYAR